MNWIDYTALAVALVVLALMLACSPVLRALAWESLRHPFVHSTIRVVDGEVQVTREPRKPGKDVDDRAEAGAK